MTNNNITTIEWYTLPRNGNGGAAIVYWRVINCECNPGCCTYPACENDIGYLLGDKPARYPVPATIPRYRLFDGSWMQRHPLVDGGYDVIVRDDAGNELDGWWSADPD